MKLFKKGQMKILELATPELKHSVGKLENALDTAEEISVLKTGNEMIQTRNTKIERLAKIN